MWSSTGKCEKQRQGAESKAGLDLECGRSRESRVCSPRPENTGGLQVRQCGGQGVSERPRLWRWRVGH